MDLANLIVMVVALGVFAHWLGWRLRLPAIVLFAAAGLLVGPVLGLIRPSADLGEVFRPVVSLCVAVILFEGGLNLHWHELTHAASGVKRLVSVGALLSFVLGSVAAHAIGALSWPTSLVFGAIMVVTGPTVILPLLRQANLNKRTASYLKWEGIINDPIGALAAVLVVQWFVLQGEADTDQVVASIGLALVAAAGIGGGAALFLGRSIQNAWIPEYLKAPVMLAMVLVVFALSNGLQHEAGLLAVTVMGLVLGNMNLPSMDEMRRFKEYITVLLVSAVFVLLTSDLDPGILAKLDWHLAALVVTMMIVVRPLAIMLATFATDMKWNDRLLLAWIAPRGVVAAAVAGVFGPELVAAGYPDAELLAPLVFSMVFATVLAHGFSIARLARRLDLTVSSNAVLIVGASPWTTDLALALNRDMNVNVLLVDNSWHRLRDARLAGVSVQYGEILSEGVQQSLELAGVGSLLAATSNDAYNALVCRHFAAEIGRDRVFQLPMYAAEETHHTRSVAKPLTGVMAFSEDSQYEELWRRHFQGWKFGKTRITETYDWENFLADIPGEAVPIGILRDAGRLTFHAPLSPIRPRAGDTVVYYFPPKPAGDGARTRDVVDKDMSRASA